VIIAILLAIGFITKYSVEFSRRVVLTWAVATPGVLILVTLCLHEVSRRLLYDPSTARRVAFAGCNEVSLSLARRIGNSGTMGMRVEGFFDDRSAERLGLSPQAVETVYGCLRALIRDGATVVLVEQDLARALTVAGRVVCLLEGRVVLRAETSGVTREQVTEAYFGLSRSGGAG